MPDPVVQEFLSNGGEIVRFREGRNTITIAYARHEDLVAYGASIHKRTSGTDQFEKAMHNFSAVYRCNTSPVIVDDYWDSHEDRVKGLREWLPIAGVSSASPQHVKLMYEDSIMEDGEQ